MSLIKRLINHFNYLTSGQPEARSSHTGAALPPPPTRPETPQQPPQNGHRQSARPAPGGTITAHTTVIGTDLVTGREISISQLAKLQGCYAVGNNGTCKTNILRTMVTSYVQNRLGVCVI